jgi:hypothetical protein
VILMYRFIEKPAAAPGSILIDETLQK